MSIIDGLRISRIGLGWQMRYTMKAFLMMNVIEVARVLPVEGCTDFPAIKVRKGQGSGLDVKFKKLLRPPGEGPDLYRVYRPPHDRVGFDLDGGIVTRHGESDQKGCFL